jgi:hypothetical protein
VDPRTGLNDVENRKFLTVPELELRPLGLPADCAIPAVNNKRNLSNYSAELSGWLSKVTDYDAL